MNNKTLLKLEFDKIINTLKDHATSTPGKLLCENLRPYKDESIIAKSLEETESAYRLLKNNSDYDFSMLVDFKETFKRLKLGAILNPDELFNIYNMLALSYKYKNIETDNITDTPNLLVDIAKKLDNIPSLYSTLNKTFNEKGDIKDTASEGLFSARGKIKHIDTKIHDTLQTLINGSLKSYLQDNIITIRDGRYCLSVKAEYKSYVKGIVHSSSSTNSTYFIEPSSINVLENEMSLAKSDESDEINKILYNLSELCIENLQTLQSNSRILANMDFSFAKARFAYLLDATKPVFNSYINLCKARHPLIDKDKIVPIDISIGDTYNQLIITGPNTGGKTVCLKTLGLLCLMAQSGLFIPADDSSIITTFDKIYVDLGDEQSIEQSLSTFSSHMSNIIKFVNNANNKTLILLDEICAGTDPTSGAALAQAILLYLKNKNSYVVATTHYSELKIYASTESNVNNASLEFNPTTLMPIYKLLIGIPGNSNAFEISEQLGLKTSIIENAKSLVNSNKSTASDTITTLEKKAFLLEQELEKIEKEKKNLTSIKEDYESKLDKIQSQKEKIISSAKETAIEILSNAKCESDLIIKELRKSKDIEALKGHRTNIKSKLNDLYDTPLNQTVPTKQIKKDDLKIGQNVHILSLNLNGVLLSLPNSKGDVYVRTGVLKTKANIDDLQVIKDSNINTNSNTTSGSVKFDKSMSLSPEINIIGKTTDDALFELGKYIDDAFLANLKTIRIVHGKGSGILRNNVRAFLKKNKLVESYKQADYGEGDSGVTIATLTS